MTDNNAGEDEYATALTPNDVDLVTQQPTALVVNAPITTTEPKPTWVLFSSCFLGMLLPLQYGWSTSQLNYFKFNKVADCTRRPITPGTCIMFPGHTKLEWIFVVNAWIFGGMVGALLIGQISDKFGRKRALRYICGVIIVGAVLQASAFNLWQFVVGRFIAGLASGAVTGTLGSYNNEVAPPHLRSPLGAILQSGIALGILFVVTTYYYLDFEDGWRIIAAFPIVLAVLFLGLSPFIMVESPVWLVMHGKRDEALAVLGRLYGPEHAGEALSWIEPKKKPVAAADTDDKAPDDLMATKGGITYMDLLSPELRLQFLIVLVLAIMQKLTGINTIFYYSSDMFAKAGLKNPRLSAIIIAIVNLFPCLVSGLLARRFGDRPMLLVGLFGMLSTAVGITIALSYEISALTIVCMAVFVISFTSTLGPLSWVFIADIFPDYGRAKVTSISVGVMWLANLVVGVGYPYISSALENLAYVPFIVLLTISLVFAIALVPETTGKTNAEIQEEFRAKRAYHAHKHHSHHIW